MGVKPNAEPNAALSLGGLSYSALTTLKQTKNTADGATKIWKLEVTGGGSTRLGW